MWAPMRGRKSKGPTKSCHFIVLVSLAVMILSGGHWLTAEGKPSRGPFFDTSLNEFNNERTCWTGEVCKTEFQSEFRCRCSRWYWCRGPGRYYHAYCSMSALGYIWVQPGGLQEEDALLNQ